MPINLAGYCIFLTKETARKVYIMSSSSFVDSDERLKEFAEVEEGPRNTPPPVYDQGDTPVKTKEVAVEAGDFWHVGNYKRIVKKVEDGAKFCEEFSQMLTERAEIESLYAKKLKGIKTFRYFLC